MTEVADVVPVGHKVLVERHYEAASPTGLELVEPGETIATTKEEEWVSKKKTEVTNTKQIETRVKRQVVLEDGKVVEDTGPMVTTNTTEDTETQEHHQTELRKLGEDDVDKEQLALEEESKDTPDCAKWVVVPNPDGLVREVKEKRVISREEIEEVKETEDVQHLGDITDQDYLEAVKSGHKDLRDVLKTVDQSKTVVASGPRLVKETTRSNKVIDTEDTRESSSVRPDGRIVTETERTTEHEEIKDDEIPEDAPEQNVHLENSQRYYKCKDQEEVEYVADGAKIATEMRYKGETTEFERRGDGIDEPNWDSLSARVKRRTNVNAKQPHRYRDLLPSTSPMDRKDALTRKPLDFDQEEETRKMETSKWLENHFGSESRSSRDSLAEEDEEPPQQQQQQQQQQQLQQQQQQQQQQPTKTSYFNVTIKSQPSRTQEPPPMPSYIANIERSPTRQEPERDRSYFQGISDWSERRKEVYSAEKRFSPARERTSPLGSREYQRSPVPDYRTSPVHQEQHRVSPIRQTSPTPPQRKKAIERRQRISQDSRYDSGYRTPSRNETRDSRDEPVEEPPPDYSPPSPPSAPVVEKKHQKTRFAAEPVKHKSGNIIGQSIRKLVGKIRSASAERKARQRAKRSPSPSYQKGHVIDGSINHNGHHHHDAMDGRRRTSSPVHRYYLGEDPFGGSIYGRENKYDGVRPARSSRKQSGRDEENRSQSTLGRFSKSTGRLPSTSTANNHRFSQTLPRHATKNEVPSRLENKSNSTINVSIINTVSAPRTILNGGPAKPARTYKSNLARSQSFNVHAGDLGGRRTMHKSNPQLNRLEEVPAGLKSPALISSINRSTQNLAETYEDHHYNTSTSRFARNGYSEPNVDSKRTLLKNLRDKTPEYFKTVHENEDDSWKTANNYKRNYNPDIYEPPTRLRDSISPTSTRNVIRRGSNSSNDYSETYHTTSRNDDPLRPSVTNTVQSFSKKTVPSKDGRGIQTIESTDKKSVTKSRYVGDPHRYYESDRRYSSASPVVIEVRNNYRK